MNWTSALDALSTGAHETEIALRLLLAAIMSGLLGYERESGGHAAGLRTHMLTALASAVFAMLAFAIFEDHGRSGDPVRVIQAIAQAGAFLAAGVIIQARGQVRGLTTGASLWMASALGVACAAGYYTLAAIAAVLAFMVLRVLKALEGAAAKTCDATDSPGHDPEVAPGPEKATPPRHTGGRRPSMSGKERV